MSLSIYADWLSPMCWTGPVLDKELRVLSRRKRTFWIKGLFPVFLALVVLSGWLSVGRGRGLTAAGLQGLAGLSRSVVLSMTWLQFILCQCMAVMMMSHAMHDEIRRRTLDVLMTTPVSSMQIVLGKLFGQLSMVWVVLALSFPVLAIIRVWGGVPWAYLVGTGCVTVCTTLCVAAFSLFLALWVKRSHQAILIALSFLVLGYLVGVLGSLSSMIPGHWGLLISPFSVFNALNQSFYSASVNTSPALWMPLCGVMLGGSALFVLLSVFTLRRRILQTIRGTRKTGRFFGIATRMFLGQKKRQDRPIRPVAGAPVLWKELGASPWVYLRKQWLWIILLSAGLGLSIVLCPPIVFQLAASAIRYMVMLRVGVMAALCVAQEKEARTWTVLLGTPVPDIWLLRHKAMAVLIRNAAGWIPLFVGFVFYLLHEEDAQSLLLSVMGPFSLLATLYMVTGMGLFASVRMKTGSMAITATLIGWVIWQLIMRFVMVLVMSNLGAFGRVSANPSIIAYYLATPILSVVAGAVMFKLAGRNLRKYAY
ncbi:MAG: ABC transporter permease subunit [Phycisphaeraceae bacterium]|nr:ABC transporter permease subunit [Phycisphaeraceae bacterium]